MASSKNSEYKKTSFLSKSNSAFIDQMYLKFINRESDLPESWEKYFLEIGEEFEIIAKEIYKAYNSKTPASKRNTPAKSLAWKRKIFKEFAGTKNVIWGEHYARRR